MYSHIDSALHFAALPTLSNSCRHQFTVLYVPTLSHLPEEAKKIILYIYIMYMYEFMHVCI